MFAKITNHPHFARNFYGGGIVVALVLFALFATTHGAKAEAGWTKIKHPIPRDCDPIGIGAWNGRAVVLCRDRTVYQYSPW